MVDTRSKKQGLKLEVIVSSTAKRLNKKASIIELNQIASQLMDTYDEIEKHEINQEPTFDDPDKEECSLEVSKHQTPS